VHEPQTDAYRCPAGQQLQKRFARVEGGKLISVYFNQKACSACPSRSLCTAGKEKRIRRWEHEAVLDAMERRLQAMPEAMAVRRCTVEHVFGTIKGWMGATHFRTRGLKHVATEASLAILAYNMKRAIAVAYNELLQGISGIQLPIEESWARNVYWVYGLVLDGTTKFTAVEFANRLAKRQIETRPFFLGIHEQPVFRTMGLFQRERYPVAEQLARQGLYIPAA